MDIVRGAVAGTVATGAMSALMLAAGRRMGEQPPDAIAKKAAHFVGADPSESQADAMAVGLHIGFGATVGAVYALLPRVGPPVARALAVSMAVYAAASQGWVPSMRILPPADEDRPARQKTMIAAHVVYGVVLGLTEDRLRARR
jgi:hypothetical protein